MLGAFDGWLFGWGWLVYGLVLLPVPVFLMFRDFYGEVPTDEKDRLAAIDRLENGTARAWYQGRMTRFLDWLDARLSAGEIARGMGPGRVAFSSGLIRRVMLLAVAYPILALVAQWLAGGAMVLGGVTVAPAGDALARVALLTWLIGLSTMGFVLTHEKKDNLAFLAGFLIFVLIALFGLPILGVLPAIAFASTVAFSVAFVVAGIGKLPVVFAICALGASALGHSSDISVAVFVAIAAAFFFEIALIITRRESRDGSQTGMWLWFLTVLVLLLGAVIQSQQLFIGLGSISLAESQMLILFLGFFPAFNAVADFASIGLTRYLLREGVQGAGWRAAALDVLGGIAIFAVLGCALIAWIHLVHPRDGVRLLDLPGLFAGLRDTPGDYWWLAFMLASTLLPTLAHGMLGMATILLRHPAWFNRLVVAGLKHDLPSARKWGAAGYCVMLTLSVCIPLWVCALVLWLGHGAVLRWTIAGFEGWARLIGVI
ncbi:MAG: hypothetical protein R3D60_02695 [Paracoccaceae bacterium]